MRNKSTNHFIAADPEQSAGAETIHHGFLIPAGQRLETAPHFVLYLEPNLNRCKIENVATPLKFLFNFKKSFYARAQLKKKRDASVALSKITKNHIRRQLN